MNDNLSNADVAAGQMQDAGNSSMTTTISTTTETEFSASLIGNASDLGTDPSEVGSVIHEHGDGDHNAGGAETDDSHANNDESTERRGVDVTVEDDEGNERSVVTYSPAELDERVSTSSSSLGTHVDAAKIDTKVDISQAHRDTPAAENDRKDDADGSTKGRENDSEGVGVSERSASTPDVGGSEHSIDTPKVHSLSTNITAEAAKAISKMLEELEAEEEGECVEEAKGDDSEMKATQGVTRDTTDGSAPIPDKESQSKTDYLDERDLAAGIEEENVSDEDEDEGRAAGVVTESPMELKEQSPLGASKELASPLSHMKVDLKFQYNPATPAERTYYKSLYNYARRTPNYLGLGILPPKEAAELFVTAKIPSEQLRMVWNMAVMPATPYEDGVKAHPAMTYEQFCSAVRFIQLFQNKITAKDEKLNVEEGVVMAPAWFEGVSGVAVSLPQVREGVLSMLKGNNSSKFMMSMMESNSSLSTVPMGNRRASAGSLSFSSFSKPTTATAEQSEETRANHDDDAINASDRTDGKGFDDSVNTCNGNTVVTDGTVPTTDSEDRKVKKSNVNALAIQEKKEYDYFLSEGETRTYHKTFLRHCVTEPHSSSMDNSSEEQQYVYVEEAVKLFSKSGMNKSTIGKLWDIVVSDPDSGKLDEDEFILVAHLVVCVMRHDLPVPRALPGVLRDWKRTRLSGFSSSSSGFHAPVRRRSSESDQRNVCEEQVERQRDNGETIPNSCIPISPELDEENGSNVVINNGEQYANEKRNEKRIKRLERQVHSLKKLVGGLTSELRDLKDMVRKDSPAPPHQNYRRSHNRHKSELHNNSFRSSFSRGAASGEPKSSIDSDSNAHMKLLLEKSDTEKHNSSFKSSFSRGGVTEEPTPLDGHSRSTPLERSDTETAHYHPNEETLAVANEHGPETKQNKVVSKTTPQRQKVLDTAMETRMQLESLYKGKMSDQLITDESATNNNNGSQERKVEMHEPPLPTPPFVRKNGAKNNETDGSNRSGNSLYDPSNNDDIPNVDLEVYWGRKQDLDDSLKTVDSAPKAMLHSSPKLPTSHISKMGAYSRAAPASILDASARESIASDQTPRTGSEHRMRRMGMSQNIPNVHPSSYRLSQQNYSSRNHLMHPAVHRSMPPARLLGQSTANSVPKTTPSPNNLGRPVQRFLPKATSTPPVSNTHKVRRPSVDGQGNVPVRRVSSTSSSNTVADETPVKPGDDSMGKQDVGSSPATRDQQEEAQRRMTHVSGNLATQMKQVQREERLGKLIHQTMDVIGNNKDSNSISSDISSRQSSRRPSNNSTSFQPAQLNWSNMRPFAKTRRKSAERRGLLSSVESSRHITRSTTGQTEVYEEKPELPSTAAVDLPPL